MSVIPRGATDAWITYVAAFLFFLAIPLARQLLLPTSWYLISVLATPAAVVAVLESLYLRPAARQTQRLDFRNWKPQLQAVALKLLGLSAIIAGIGSLQLTLSEYAKEFYQPWFELLTDVGPWATCLIVAYVTVTDGFQTDAARQQDLYLNTGCVLLRRSTAISSSAWAAFAREWLVKAFFLPLMTSAYSRSLMDFDNTMQRLAELIKSGALSWGPVFSSLHDALYLVDVTWATFGYALSCSLLDAHVRSVEPTALGWAAALACYQPFNASVIDAYLLFGGPSNNWQVYLQHAPAWCQGLWGSAVLLTVAVYSWATVVFGIRFSNLTNRGIITCGPYAYMRHPAYVAKNLSWWLVNVPWSTHDGFQMAFKCCVRLAGLNCVYALRAWTEEQHLLQDAAYLEYYNAIQKRYGLPLKQASDQQQQQHRRQQQQQQHQQQGDRPHHDAECAGPSTASDRMG